MIVSAFVLGMLLCGLTLALLRVPASATEDKFGSAIAMFCAWCAFGMLLMAGLYGLGLPALGGAAVLVGLKLNSGEWLGPLVQFKLPLGVGAIMCSVLAWIGILNLLEEIPNG